MVTNFLFIEGEKETDNGNLREGFNKLLRKKVTGSLPRIVMGQGKSLAVKKFRNSKIGHARLLCDLDKDESGIASDLSENQLHDKKDDVFYMIQEMESWFLSQPSILDEFYQVEIGKKIPKKPITQIAEPDKVLQKLTKDTNRGKYHKIRHAVVLLEKLDAEQLYKDFSDFKRLVDSLNNK